MELDGVCHGTYAVQLRGNMSGTKFRIADCSMLRKAAADHWLLGWARSAGGHLTMRLSSSPPQDTAGLAGGSPDQQPLVVKDEPHMATDGADANAEEPEEEADDDDVVLVE